MTTYTQRPNAFINGSGTTTPAADATVLSYLGDNSDATFVSNPGTSGTAQRIFRVETATIGANEFIARVGFSMRWKGNSSGQYSIGGAVWYDDGNSDSPSNWTLTPNNSAAFTTTELGTRSVSWPLSYRSNIFVRWFDGRSQTSWAATQTADVWAKLYTIAKATATPSNRTETESVYPSIPVSVAATIDWEAGTQTFQNFRKVTVEVRVESGGSGVGTGTLVSSQTQDVLFTSTGTLAQNVVMPDPLPNGTYKVYSRALRYREDGIVRADQYGDWSTASTLTMSAPLPATPTMTVTPDLLLDAVTVTVTPISSTGYSSPFITVERSDDGGLTWGPVRGASAVEASFGVVSSFVDYEAPRATAVSYRARIDATFQTSLNSSAYAAAQQVTLTADTWNLKDVTNPALNVSGLNVTGAPTEAISEELGVFRPLGRKFPVIVAGTLSGWDGSFKVSTTSAEEWEALRSIATSQAILRLESPYGWAKYIRLVSGTKSSLYGSSTAPRRDVDLAYVEVAMPEIVPGEATVNPIIPSEIDGGNAATTEFGDFYDGGNASSTGTFALDGGTA